MNLQSHSGIMGEAEKLFEQPSAPSNELDWSSPVPDRDSTTPKVKYWDKRYRELKADPLLYAAYLERKRKERHARKTNKRQETERKRKWRAANREKDRILHKAHHAVEYALRDGKLIKPDICDLCRTAGVIEAHHHLGYETEHFLDVMWLCQLCHSKQHATGFRARTMNTNL